jgi:hypothetical protein
MYKAIFSALVLITCLSANSWARYSLYEVRNITGGTIDKNGNANFQVEYWIGICPGTTVKVLLADAPPPAPTTNDTKFQTVGILVKSSDNVCPAAQKKAVANVVVAGPLPSGGAALYSIQHLDVINFALNAPEAKAEFVNRVPTAISALEQGGFNKAYTVSVETVENGIGPKGPSTHPCFTKIVVSVLNGISGPVSQIDTVHTTCAMNSPVKP